MFVDYVGIILNVREDGWLGIKTIVEVLRRFGH